jgi:hypothetical protein
MPELVSTHCDEKNSTVGPPSAGLKALQIKANFAMT